MIAVAVQSVNITVFLDVFDDITRSATQRRIKQLEFTAGLFTILNSLLFRILKRCVVFHEPLSTPHCALVL